MEPMKKGTVMRVVTLGGTYQSNVTGRITDPTGPRFVGMDVCRLVGMVPETPLFPHFLTSRRRDSNSFSGSAHSRETPAVMVFPQFHSDNTGSKCGRLSCRVAQVVGTESLVDHRPLDRLSGAKIGLSGNGTGNEAGVIWRHFLRYPATLPIHSFLVTGLHDGL
jgi:hypothetical protein